jgi:hypothetical protein
MSPLVLIAPDDLRVMIRQAVNEALLANKASQDDMVSPTDVMQHYGVSLATQTKWRKEGLVDFTQVGRIVRYKVSDLQRFFDQHGAPVNRRGAKKNNPKLMFR